LSDGQTNDSHYLAIHIEGIGPLSGISSPADRLGYLWTSESPYDADTDGTVTFQPVDQSNPGAATVRNEELDIDRISSVGTGIKVFDAEIQFSSFSLPVKANQFNVELLTHAKRNPAFEITSKLDKTSTSVETNAKSGQLTGTVGFVRDETIYFESHSGGGTYSIKRGYYLSTPQFHGAGTNIYDEVPFWDRRKVRLYTFRMESSPVTLDRRDVLLIDGATEHDHNNIVVNATGYGSFLQQAAVNKDTFYGEINFLNGSSAIETKTPDDGRNTLQTTQGLKFDSGGESKIVKSDVYTDGSDIRTWLQLNTDLLIPYNNDSIAIEEFQNESFNGSQGSSDKIPFEQTADDIPDEINRIWEPLVINRRYDKIEGTNFSATREITQFSDHDDKYIYHAVSIAACLLLSSYSETVDAENFDVLHGNWGAGSYSSLVDGLPSDIRDLVEAYPRDQVDYFVMGLGGETESVWDRITDLLQTYGYYWSVKANGQLTIKKVTNNTTSFWSAAQDNPVQPKQSGTLRKSSGRDEVVDIIEANVGKIPGYQKPIPVQVQIQKGQDPRRLTQMKESKDRKISMNSIFVGNIQRAQRMLEAKTFLQSYARPRFEFRVDDYLNLDSSLSRNYSLGAEVSIKSLPLARKWASRNGTQKRISKDDIEFGGRIIRRNFNPKKRSYDLTVEIIGISGLARWRAPSGVVLSTSTSPLEVTLENASNGGGEVLRGAKPFHVGDEVQFFKEDGQKISTKVHEITSISGDTIELSNAPLDSGVSAGVLCELSYLDINVSGSGYRNTSVIGNIDRPYVGLADTNSTLGDSNIDADIYGEG